MAKIAVISDTHGSIENLSLVLDRLGQPDSLFHLGDVVQDAPRLAGRLNTGFVSVRGNCDPYSAIPLEQIVTWHGQRILLVHGHLYSNKLALFYKAKAEGCSVVCYGHSHVASIERQDGILLLNPGSLSRPRAMQKPCCALLTVTEDAVDASLLFAE